jgi:hypothetical protein
MRALLPLILLAQAAHAMPAASFRSDQALVSLGAGISGYVDAAPRAATAVIGSSWDFRLTFGARAWLAFEAEYLGTYASLNGTGKQTPFVVSNAVEALVRVNFTDWAWQPFVFVGAGYDRAELHARGTDPTAAAPFAVSADRFVLPLGVGFDVTFVRHLNFDLRASYRAHFGQVLLAGARDDQWTVTTHVGYAF